MAEASESSLFVVCLPGLEPLLARELGGLGVTGVEVAAGGVACSGDLRSIYRVNLESGLASHVLLRVAEFGARNLADLDTRGARIPWGDWLPAGASVRVRATCRGSRIYHSGAAEERIARHLAEELGPPRDPAAEGEPITVRVRIDDNRCTVSVDTSGAPLHRRGWRLEGGKAPLREDLAHALVLVSGWDLQSPLLDPLMGSGTILIEAATLARGLAPGRLRSFAIEQSALHDPALAAAVRAAAEGHARPGPRLVGGDRDALAVAATLRNAERAGVLDDLDVAERSLSATFAAGAPWPDRGALVTNPPYGRRLDRGRELLALYQSLGELARDLPDRWSMALAAADRRLALRTGVRLQTAFLAPSGGLPIRGMAAGPIRAATPRKSSEPDSRPAGPEG